MSISSEQLLMAYSSGIFPMAESQDDPELFWVDPRRRGVLPLDGFHISKSLARRLRRPDYSVALNHDLAAVLDACADREETWINGTIRELMLSLHKLGHVHSLEIRRDGHLVGGVYGVSIGGAFFGESMFSRATDGSKIALAWLIDHLRRCEFRLFDAQFITPHLESLGAVEISRADYRRQLSEAISVETSIHAKKLETGRQALVQRMIHTS
ncbi:MAG: leucyl/phenylalanyl-tRNA--protein transferase [Boseongicola sp.]|nr:MAG: leucyl/phenylalanyl-tRNA--protein transferase [Boseongicola sp.]